MLHHGELCDDLGIDEKSLPQLMKINVLETFTNDSNEI